ncbi:MAG: lycopene cyclase domain-containing protein [Verrucomicrobiota bacterium]
MRIGYLPLEEYAFFVLQSVNVMLAVRALFHFFPDWQTGEGTEIGKGHRTARGRVDPPVGIHRHPAALAAAPAGPRVNYAIHLAWFLPVIYAQWLIAPPLFLNHATLLAVTTAGFGIYYTAADLVAVRGGTWFFDERQITGLKLGGLLPWEEVAFFFLTSLLIAQSYLLLLPADLR